MVTFPKFIQNLIFHLKKKKKKLILFQSVYNFEKANPIQ